MCFPHEPNKNELCVLDSSPRNFSDYAYWFGKKPDKQFMQKNLAKNTSASENSFNFHFIIKIILIYILDSVKSVTVKQEGHWKGSIFGDLVLYRG